MLMRRNGLRATTVVAGVLAAWTLAVPVFAVDVVDDPVQFDERGVTLNQEDHSRILRFSTRNDMDAAVTPT